MLFLFPLLSLVDVPEPQDFEDVAVCSLQKFCKTEELDKRTPFPGDIVFFDERPMTYMVYLVGYGSYKDQIRVVRFFENHHTRENGRWECTGCCRLEVGDALLCTDNVTAIHRGSYCVFVSWLGFRLGSGSPLLCAMAGLNGDDPSSDPPS